MSSTHLVHHVSEVVRREACDICHKKPTLNRKLTHCKRCKKCVCSQCCKDKINTFVRVAGKQVATTLTVCDMCREEISSMRKMKEAGKLKYGTESKLGLRLLKLVSATPIDTIVQEYREAHRVLKLRENEQIYLRTRTAIQEDRLYSKMSLAQSLFQLICITSADLRQEEQNDKAKHLLLAVSIDKPLQCLKCISRLALFLGCFLTESQVYHLVNRIYKDYIPECFSLRKEEEIQGLASAFRGQFESDNLVLPYCQNFTDFYAQMWRSLTAGIVNPEVTYTIIQSVLKDKINSVENFNRSLSCLIKAGMKASSGDEDLQEQILHVDPEKMKSIIEGLSKSKSPSPLKQSFIEKPEKQQTYNQLLIQNEELRQQIKALRRQEQKILMQFRQKYLLIEDNIRQEEQAIHDYYGKQEAKLQQQKNDYIEKIVKLNDQIEKMKEDIGKMKESEKYYLSQIETLQNRLSHAIKNKGDQQYESISPSSTAIDKHQKKKILLALIDTMNTGFQTPPKALSKEEVDQMERDWIAHMKTLIRSQRKMSFTSNHEQQFVMKRRNSKERMESDTSRLLALLSKKQEKFVLQIHQKDKIIECYQDVIWHIENNLELPKNDIARRVDQIIKNRNAPKEISSQKKIKDKKEDCSVF